MAERAQVTSLEAVESFRARLIVFLTKARAVVEEIDDEKLRVKAWLQHEQRGHWDRECRRRSRALEEAQQELFSAKISRISVQSAAQVLAVERAKRALREAEEKRDAIRRWSREFDNQVEPLAKQLEPLQGFLTTDMAKAVAYLGSVQRILEAYVTTPSGGPVPVPEAPTLPAPDPTESTASQGSTNPSAQPHPAEGGGAS